MKKKRHKAIKNIISTEQITTQESLLEKLFDKGFELTQATLSRDIKELKIIKTPTNEGSYVYQMNNDLFSGISLDSGKSQLSSYGFLGIEFSGNLAVVKTRPGYAMGIAAEIDSNISREIIGTVAGDDTIILVIREDIKREEVIQSLSKVIGLN